MLEHRVLPQGMKDLREFAIQVNPISNPHVAPASYTRDKNQYTARVFIRNCEEPKETLAFSQAFYWQFVSSIVLFDQKNLLIIIILFRERQSHDRPQMS